MIFTKIFTIVLLFVMTSRVYSQDLSLHKWKHRIVLIITKNSNSKVFKKQIEEIQTNREGTEERKLIIYEVTPKQYKIGLDDNSQFKKSSVLFKKYRASENAFEIVLIGLDGNIKFRQNKFLSHEDLFETIDAMPIRQTEIRKTKNKTQNSQ